MSGSKIASSRSSRPYRLWAGGGILVLAARRLVELGASLRVEARQDRLDEGILQQASDDLPRAELGLVESARDRGHGRDLATRLILQDLHGGADRTFVEPTAKALCLLLFPVDGADADIAEERLDVARYGAVSHPKLGIYRELARRDVDAAVGAHEAVHTRHVGLIDPGREIHVPSARPGPQRHGHNRIAGTHESALEPDHCRALLPLIAQVLDGEIRVREDEPVFRRRGAVHEAERAPGDVETVDPEIEVGLVDGPPRRLEAALRPLLLDFRGARRVDVLRGDPLHAHTVEDQSRNRGSVLDVPGQGEGAAAHGEVVALDEGLEVIELDALEPKRRLDPRVRLGEKIRAAVEPELPRVEHYAFHVDIGRVDAVLGSDVPDVFRAHIEPAQPQWLEGADIEVGEVAIAHLQPVDLEVQSHGLERALPPAVLQGNIAPGLRAEVLEIDVYLRPIEGHIRYELAFQQSPPINGRRQGTDPRHRRVGIGVL